MTENIPPSSQRGVKRADDREPLKERQNEPSKPQTRPPKEKHVMPDDLADYQKLSKIGEGTYGVVYKAYQKASNKLVALKRVPLHYDQGIPMTTVREIALLKEVSHRNVVKLLDLIQKDATVYLVFEYLDMDLGKYMKKVGRPGLTAKHIKSFMHQLLNGVAYLHSHRILHRDMKPQNLMIDRTGKLSITDFGLSRAFGVPMRTFTSQVVTLWYRAPEILLGSPHYSTGVDMWSVGCIFAEMMTMQPLFPGRTQIGELFSIFR
ncbi:Cyclin-dependent kinase 2 [Apophysomyces ossiformis]|uniref:cyclin-dependent kinase n=1 Tax=Apophysomyces ossiformis TaxID=679940 RepID=A0A8H7BXK9_9FUNG|nr:Cyclin-dependent kinase 2 [Apophysomyces ossiformis]